ncbi:hypothetical protein OBBRIDRAFT_787228 [Obba rivulosa]|uniref:HIT domain-containing protein n=1 Tax=Obba rivulosa TaxID=1052685 RepID=A0A8E2DVV4_9APHY|nr:hypothetical protein OBBRIDRAFT_787228 [Obba rivulosa]
MAFAPKAGCPMCGIVASGLHTPTHSPSPNATSFPTSSQHPEILWTDDSFTIYRERANPVSSKGHIIIVFNLHVPSLYTLSSSDLPLLVTLRDLGSRILSSLQAPSSLPSPSNSPYLPPTSPTSMTPNTSSMPQHLLSPPEQQDSITSDAFRIGFITPPFKDNKIPVTDHLHAHAYILPADRMGWWRGLAYSPVAWYAVDDLIAEIREESSNNRVRGTKGRPIDSVPHAGARRGTADGFETTDAGLGTIDIEGGELSPRISITSVGSSGDTRRRAQGVHTPPVAGPSSGAHIPHLRV